jgi:hypothetical protein
MFEGERELCSQDVSNTVTGTQFIQMNPLQPDSKTSQPLNLIESKDSQVSKDSQPPNLPPNLQPNLQLVTKPIQRRLTVINCVKNKFQPPAEPPSDLEKLLYFAAASHERIKRHNAQLATVTEVSPQMKAVERSLKQITNRFKP